MAVVAFASPEVLPQLQELSESNSHLVLLNHQVRRLRARHAMPGPDAANYRPSSFSMNSATMKRKISSQAVRSSTFSR
eukprot:3852407-Rhodomonas_salina.2